MAIHEDVAGSSSVPNSQNVPDLNVVISDGEECVRRALAEVKASVGQSEEASVGYSFLNIMGGLAKGTRRESEGLPFADILQRADLLSESVLEGVVDTRDLPLC